MPAKSLILLSIIFLIASAGFAARSYMFIKNASKTEARVKSIEQKHRSIVPTFEYTVNGREYEYEGASTSTDAYKIGDKETVYYDPSDPSDSMAGTFMNLWFIPVFCGGFFIILLSVGVGLMTSRGSKPDFHIKRR